MSIGRVVSVAEPTAVAEGAGLLAAFGTSVVIVACSSLGRIGPRKIACHSPLPGSYPLRGIKHSPCPKENLSPYPGP